MISMVTQEEINKYINSLSEAHKVYRGADDSFYVDSIFQIPLVNHLVSKFSLETKEEANEFITNWYNMTR